MYGQNTFAEGYAIGRDSTGNSNNGWGGDNAWWIIILLIFGYGGFGNGFGGNSRNTGSSGVTDGYVLASDFSNIERKIDGVNNGICDGFYAVNTSFGNLNNTIATNTAAIQNTLTQGFSGLNTGMVTQGYENRIAVQGIGNQLSNCCCDIREGIAGVNYNLATQANDVSRQMERGFCDNAYSSANNTRDIIYNAHSDTDRIMARLDAMENSRKDEKIAAQQATINSLENKINMSYWSRQIVDEVRPCPQPCYITCNPYSYQASNCNCGNNNCC